MENLHTIHSKVMEIVGELGIIRSEGKKVDFYGAPYGQRIVWYDVCLERGEGDIIESFKTMKAALNFAKNY